MEQTKKELESKLYVCPKSQKLTVRWIPVGSIVRVSIVVNENENVVNENENVVNENEKELEQ